MSSALTVAQVIERLQACNPDAYPMIDDNGIGLELVDIEDGYYSHLATGDHVEAVYFVFRGEREAAEKMREGMALWAASHPPAAETEE